MEGMSGSLNELVTLRKAAIGKELNLDTLFM